MAGEDKDRNEQPCGDVTTADGDESICESAASLEIEAEAPDADVGGRLVRWGSRTTEAFTVRDYRLLWLGAFLSNVGTWLQLVALGWLVVQLGGTAATLGVVNFASMVPVFFLSVFAGAMADRVDRKRLVIWTQVGMGIMALALGVLTSLRLVTVPLATGLVFISGTFTAFSFPAWQAMIPDVVPRKMLMNAIALNSAQFNGARLVGPAIAGLIVVWFGVAGCFYLNALSFLFIILAMLAIHPAQKEPRRGEGGPWQTLTGGLRYAYHERAVGMILMTVAAVTVLGMPYSTLMPLIAKQLGVGAGGLGFLMAAGGLGAVLGATGVAGLPYGTRRERVALAGLGLLGASLVALGFSSSYAMDLALLPVVGASFMAVVSSLNTSLQSSVPQELRGRIMALFVLAFMGIMPFSSLAFGFLAEYTGTGVAIAIGGGLLLLYGVPLVARPGLLRPRVPVMEGGRP